MTTKLSQHEYDTVFSAVNREDYDKNVFYRAVQKMRLSSGIRPDWVRYEGFPSLITEWRRHSKEWALAHLDRHQAGCDAMWAAYWEAFRTEPGKPASQEAQPHLAMLRAELLALVERLDALRIATDEEQAEAQDKCDAAQKAAGLKPLGE